MCLESGRGRPRKEDAAERESPQSVDKPQTLIPVLVTGEQQKAVVGKWKILSQRPRIRYLNPIKLSVKMEIRDFQG